MPLALPFAKEQAMPSIRLKTHLNGPDNQGGAPWGMPGVTYVVDEATAEDAVRRGFAEAVAEDAVNTEADQLAHLHAAPSVARGNAVAARRAADEARARVKDAQAEADRADDLAQEAEDFADRVEKTAPKDDPGNRAGLTSKDAPGHPSSRADAKEAGTTDAPGSATPTDAPKDAKGKPLSGAPGQKAT